MEALIPWSHKKKLIILGYKIQNGILNLSIYEGWLVRIIFNYFLEIIYSLKYYINLGYFLFSLVKLSWN